MSDSSGPRGNVGDIKPCRERVAGILAAIAANRSARESRGNGGGDGIGLRHLDFFRECLAQKIQIFVYGIHSPDWMEALAPASSVWSGLDLVCEVVQGDAAEPELAKRIRPDCYPVVIPLMEDHARAAPMHIASLTPAADVITLLADKSLFAAYVLERNLGAFAPKLYQSLDDVDYPCIVKPTDLNGGRGVCLVPDKNALAQIIDDKARLGENFLVQSWVGGCTEYVTHAVLQDGKIVWEQTFQYDMSEDDTIRTGQITGGCKIERVPTTKAFLEILSVISDDLDLSGPVNVDYKIVDGKPLIFEINPRLGGSLMRPENADLLAQVLKIIIDGAVASDRFFAGVILASELFDLDFYISPNNEFDPPVNNPALHYFREGFLEGRDPSKDFSTEDYTELHLRNAHSAINPLVHFELLGRNRQHSVFFHERRLIKSAVTMLDGPRRQGVLQSILPKRLTAVRAEVTSDSLRPLHIWNRPIHGSSCLSSVTGLEAQHLIVDRKLRTVEDSWHYSWDVERFFPKLYIYETHKYSYVLS